MLNLRTLTHESGVELFARMVNVTASYEKADGHYYITVKGDSVGVYLFEGLVESNFNATYTITVVE